MAFRTPQGHFKTIVRGATLACGVCGRRGLFKRFRHMATDCPRCGLHFEREEGSFVGAVGINTILTFGLLLIGMVTFFAVTYPDVPAGPWVFLVGLAIIPIPILLYPVSKTLWLAIELVMRPPEPDEVRPVEEWKD